MKKLYIFLVFLALQQAGVCQTAPYIIDQNTGKCCGGGDQGMGSSFKVAGAGQINSVTLYHRSNQAATGTLYIYKGNGPNPDSLLRTQSVSVFSEWAISSELVITLTNPVAVKKDSVYTIYLIGFPLRHSSSSNTYANGTLWTNTGEVVAGDLDFRVNIGVLVAGVSKSILAENTKIILTDQGKNLQVIGAGKNIDLKLFTSDGKLLGESTGDNFKLPSLQEGVYIVQIIKDQELISKKIFIAQ